MVPNERQKRLIEILHDRLDRMAVVVERENRNSLGELLFLEKSAFYELSKELESEMALEPEMSLELAKICEKIEDISRLISQVLADLEKKIIGTNDKLKKIRKYSSRHELQNLLSKSV